MTKNFHAVETSRQWRDRVTRDVAGMSQREKVAYFQRFNSVAVLKAKPVPTKALPLVLPVGRKKGFDAVSESRKWRERVSRKIAKMTPAQELAYFNRRCGVRPSGKKALAHAA